MTNLPATAYRAGSGDRLPATVTIRGSRIEVQLAEGERWDLAQGELTVEARIQDPPQLILLTRDQRAVALPRSALDDLTQGSDPEFLAQLARIRGAPVRRATWLGTAVLVLVLGLGALAVGLYLAIPALARGAVHALPPTVDRELGDSAWESMEGKGAALTAAAIVEPLEAVIARIRPQLDPEGRFDFRLTVLDDDQVNAFALPGGRMVVYRGLLEKATRLEQVAGVVGHEMAHVTRRHGLEAMAKQAGVLVSASLILGDVSGILAMGGAMALGSSYSRDAEREADAESCRALIASGIDPRGLPEFFATMQAIAATQTTTVPGWLSSHPDDRERIENLEHLITAAGSFTTSPLVGDWAALQRALPVAPAGSMSAAAPPVER